MTDFDLTPAEQQQLDGMRQELLKFGYQEIAEHGELKIGTRIRHIGQHWPEAYDKGTGVVAVLTEKPDSTWSRDYGKPDIELIALWDKPWYTSRLSQLAQYHVRIIEERAT